MSDKCPSCNIPYVDHPGLVGTCSELSRYREALEQIAGCQDLTHWDRVEIAREALASTCGDCGNVLEEVRPGKHQCNHCEVGL